MRILGGRHGGRKLRTPSGHGTRPMLAVVRESIFSIAAPWLEGARVLDLFAGAGSLGLEAVSRGARHLRSLETGAEARSVLAANLETLGESEAVELVALDALDPNAWGSEPFDLVFLDPPFPLMRQPAGKARVMRALEALVDGALAHEGLIVLHVPRELELEAELPESLARTAREHGEQALWYLQRRTDLESEG